MHKDGTATYADFGPATAGRAYDPKGSSLVFGLSSKVAIGSDGLPTRDSLAKVANEVAGPEKQSASSVRLAYFKTSDAETAALDAYIQAAAERQAHGNQPSYIVGYQDCIAFCLNGLQAAGRGSGSQIMTGPNIEFNYLGKYLADAFYDGATGRETIPGKGASDTTFKPCKEGDTSQGCK